MDALRRDLTAGGVRLRVAEIGSGPSIVLLHGVFQDGTTWSPVARELAPGFRVVMPDLPGFGESEMPPPARYPYGIDALSEAVTDLFAGLAIGQAALVGQGLGAAIAIALVARRPELVSRLVLVGAQCYGPEPGLGQRMLVAPVLGSMVLKQMLGRSGFRALYRDVLLGPDSPVGVDRIDYYYDRFSPPAARGAVHATLRATRDTRQVVAQLARIHKPTLVIWGRHDQLYPAGYGQRLARDLRGSGFELLDAGHLVHEERPIEVARSIAAFVRAERPT